MLDSMFQGETDQTLDDLASRPLPPSKVRPSFALSAWNTTKAPFRGVGAGANESAGFLSDALGAFAKVQAGYGAQADPSLLFSPDKAEQRYLEGEAARKAIDSGAAFSTEAGTNFRLTAREFMPDPNTSNVVENTLFGLTRFTTKAVTYSAAAGPLPGALLTGTDEGMTEADRLKSEGVDLKTRTKVGTVVGVASGLSTVLPLAGATKGQTAALVAAGGPGAFIAQQAATKAILEHAGYDQIADQYDPFDPVGLAVSTLIPAAFGVHGFRANVKAKASADAIAAARVQQLQEQIASSGLHEPGDVVGAEQHVAAVAKASDQMAAGERVNVSDTIDSSRIPPEKLPAFDRRQDMELRKTVSEMSPDEMRQALLTDELTGLGNRRAYTESEKLPVQASIDIDSLKWVNDNLGHEGGDHLIAALGQALREESAHAFHLSGDEFAAQFHSEEHGHALLDKVRNRLKEAVIEVRMPDGSTISKKGVEFSYGLAKTIQEADVNLRADKAAREASGQRAGRGAEPHGVSKEPAPGKPNHEGHASAQAVTPKSSPDQAQSAQTAAGKGNVAPAQLDAHIDEIARQSPDMMVQLEGMDSPMRLADALEAVKAEAAKEAQDAPLLQVAADCFLRNA